MIKFHNVIGHKKKNVWSAIAVLLEMWVMLLAKVLNGIADKFMIKSPSDLASGQVMCWVTFTFMNSN